MSPENAFVRGLYGSSLFVMCITKAIFSSRNSNGLVVAVVVLPLRWLARLTPLDERRAQLFESPWDHYGLVTELNNRGNKWRSVICLRRARAEMTSLGENWIA